MIVLDVVVEAAGRFTGAFGLGASPGLPRLQPSRELSGVFWTGLCSFTS